MPADYNHHQPSPPPKADTSKLISLLLKALIMTMITSLFFLLIGLVSFVFLPLILISLHRRRRRSRTTTDLSLDIKRLPQFRFLEHQQCCECVICMDGFRQGQWCRRLDCGHVFHTKCVDTWLVRVAACPTCRSPIVFPSH